MGKWVELRPPSFLHDFSAFLLPCSHRGCRSVRSSGGKLGGLGILWL